MEKHPLLMDQEIHGNTPQIDLVSTSLSESHLASLQKATS